MALKDRYVWLQCLFEPRTANEKTRCVNLLSQIFDSTPVAISHKVFVRMRTVNDYWCW